MQVKAVTELALLDDEILGLFCVGHTAWKENEFVVHVAVKLLALSRRSVLHDILRSSAPIRPWRSPLR